MSYRAFIYHRLTTDSRALENRRKLLLQCGGP